MQDIFGILIKGIRKYPVDPIPGPVMAGNPDTRDLSYLPGGNCMKLTHIGIIAVMLVVIAVVIAGCSSTQTKATTGSASPGAASSSGGAAASPAATAGSQSSGSAVAAGSSASASNLFGGLSYNWIEYKTTSSSGGQSITMYIKWEKSGKCTMRFENAPAGMPASMDCSSTGGKTQSNPNDVSTNSDVKYVYVGPDVVTVPAGTFTADKYTATVNGATATYWIVKDKGLVKMVGGTGEGSSTMELNGMG
jgi:hypothetical protein